MERILTILALAALSVSSAFGQRLDPAKYVYPVRDVAGVCSANFGEMRPDHFHSGVDIKTDGVEGKTVVAAADGYISRIVESPTGYGRALYVTHRDGTMSVYGHLSRFRKDIDSMILAERYRRKRNSLDLYFKAGRYPVRQGESIALSGNTGNSFGPHLHFEIRDGGSGKTLNLIEQGVIRVPDTIPPIIAGLWYVAVDSAGIVPVHSRPRKIEIRRTGHGRYAATTEVKAAPKGYFIVETTDRKNGVQNRFGIYRITERIDDRTVFEYRMDGYAFEDTRYCNAVSYYPMQLQAQGEAIRLAKLGGGTSKYYTTIVEQGLVRVAEGQRRQVNITVEDDSRNLAMLDFTIVGGAAAPEIPEIADSIIINCRRDFAWDNGEVAAEIPAGALYESAVFSCRRPNPATPQTLCVLTPVYEIMNSDTPLHKAVTISIRAFIPQNLRQHAAMAIIDRKGKAQYAGGKWRDGAFEAQSRRFGNFCVVLDTVAPVIRPRIDFTKTDKTDLRRNSEISFSVSDDFSGIKDYSATIDGEWVTLDRSPIRGTVTHRFDHLRYARNADHEMVVTVTDNCGNTAVWRGRFFR